MMVLEPSFGVLSFPLFLPCSDKFLPAGWRILAENVPAFYRA